MSNVVTIYKPDVPRYLILDVESLPNIVCNWHPSQKYTPRENVLITKTIFCAQWKWYGEKKVHTVSALDDKSLNIKYDKNKRICTDMFESKYVIEKIVEQMNQAHFIIGYNSDKFDLRYINAEASKHNIKINRFPRTIDLMKVAKKEFFLNYYSLDYLCEFLGLPLKKKTDMSMFVKAVAGHVPTIKYLVKYGAQDIKVTEQLLKRLRTKVINNLPQTALMSGIYRCHHEGCGSVNLRNYGTYHTRDKTNRRVICKDCWGVTKLQIDRKEALKDIKLL